MSRILDRYQDQLLLSLKGAGAFQLYAPASDRAVWGEIGDSVRAALIRGADHWLTKPIPPITLDHYLDYAQRGDQSAFLAAYNARRQSLRALVMGTCAELTDRYIAEIARLIWAICEESTWIIPSNNALLPGENLLPDPAEPLIDAYAARTAADLAMAVQLIGEQLDIFSPRLAERIEQEVTRRIIVPFSTLEEWLVGPRADAIACLAGCMVAFLSFEWEDRRRWQCMRRAWRALSNQLDLLAPDGGVRGGLSAWQEIAGALVDCLTAVYYATDGEIDALSDPQVVRLCRFPVAAHLGRGYFQNPGEQPMRAKIRGMEAYRLGMASRDAHLCDLGAYLIKTGGGDLSTDDVPLVRRAFEALHRRKIDQEPLDQPLIRQAFLPDTQYFLAREENGSEGGLTVAMHGGDNGSPGGHLDVGDFALFAGGEPVLVDAGYIQHTEYHNLPTVGRFGQLYSGEHGASDIECRLEADFAMMSLDIAGAYPADAGIDIWQRTLILTRGGGVQLIELFDLREAQEVSFHFLCAQEPSLGDDYAQIGALRIRWDANLTGQVEKLALREGTGWDALYRIILTTERAVAGGKYNFSMKEIRTYG